ncbi:MAG: superoxide dismutase [Bacteroidales bacterium]|nr:superoxide dismutase [Bacteroidales bacterium]
MLNRREIIQTATVGTVALGLPTLFATPQAAAAEVAGFTLPPLPYACDALEPHLDARTMEIHHDKHHAGYVANLNKALAGHSDWLKLTPIQVISKLAELPEGIRTAVRNNGGGHANHSLFWTIMSKKGGEPRGDLKKAIDDSFGSFGAFQKEFGTAALKQFGSGWAWLVPGKEKPLTVVATANQDNPVMTGAAAPILGIDVWEHAYYLKYQNKRADYIAAWFQVINWDQVAANYHAAKKG